MGRTGPYWSVMIPSDPYQSILVHMGPNGPYWSILVHTGPYWFLVVQALCSSLSGIIATRAVFEAVGVGDGAATPMGATLTWLLRGQTPNPPLFTPKSPPEPKAHPLPAKNPTVRTPKSPILTPKSLQFGLKRPQF